MEKGFGFIRPENGSKDVFFHARQIGGGLRFDDLQEGETVEFEIGEGRDGRQEAIGVTPV